MDNTIKLLPISWYTAEEYDAAISIMADRDNLPRSYDAWLKKAIHTEQQAIASGYAVQRVIINPKEFSRWCHDRGLDINAEARGRYITEVAINSKSGNR
ncbi:hypothetical protein Q9292_09960 [Methylophilus sp. VKM B-3414]|uniref:hypothetical protein n=1 Tax=Methylophilus sp. VKM B-3414 TaxID=3076121 RepID=UPI0028C8C568|nr:hypothetical protein [Methylophilus sp. VKM B-3414]MDT7849935.1 hypothetical protein [Methylophilus sp. VKM B-3414]